MKIFVICGKARHGKDTTALIIDKYFEKNNKKVINLQYSSYLKEYAKRITGWDGSEETKPRELLQYLGTEYIRKEIDNLFFVKRMIGDLKVYSKYFDVATISDARMVEEIDELKKEFPNVCAIKVVRPNFDNGLSAEQQKHATEIALDNYDKIDHVLLNDGTLEDLEKKIEDLMEVI